MKIVLDTTNKIIKIEESVNLGELMDALIKLLPQEEWKTFKLETNTQIVWSSPIIFREHYPAFPHPYTYPWYNPSPIITYDTGGAKADYQLQSGTYCVEV